MAAFIGQSKIIKELNYIIPRARDQNIPYNILFSARTGYGKTFLGVQVVGRVAPYQILLNDDASVIATAIRSKRTRANLIDEAHIIRNMEVLYPLMDEGNYFMLFATNQSYELPEAFKRRCIPMVFDKYNKTELARIAHDRLMGMRVDNTCLDEIVKASNYTPGNIIILCIRLRTVFESRGGFTLSQLNDCLVNVFNIQDGLDVRCREYLEVLGRLNYASLDTLAYVMGVSKDIVKNEVENVLLAKGLVAITSKGRSLPL